MIWWKVLYEFIPVGFVPGNGELTGERNGCGKFDFSSFSYMFFRMDL
nr:hypothetical protein [uncultured Draconibacterium sp.]